MSQTTGSNTPDKDTLSTSGGQVIHIYVHMHLYVHEHIHTEEIKNKVIRIAADPECDDNGET